jgi:hypothetical protein
MLYLLEHPERFEQLRGSEAVLVGFGVSFPTSDSSETVEYQVNEVYARQLELDL